MTALAEHRQEVAGGFDYSAVDRATASEARALAERVRTHGRRIVSDIIDLGSALIRMKERLGHGQFGPWMRAEFGENERTAQRFMNVAEQFATKSDTVSVLPPTIVYALSAPSTPPAIREEIVSEIAKGQEPDPYTIGRRIKRAKDEAREALREAKRTPEERKKVASRAKRQRTNAERAELEREAAARKEHEETAARLAKALEAADIVLAAIGKDADRLIALMAASRPEHVVAAIRERHGLKPEGRWDEAPTEHLDRLRSLLALDKVRPVDAGQRWDRWPYAPRRA